MKQRLSLMMLCGLLVTGCDPSSDGTFGAFPPISSPTPTATPNPTPVVTPTPIADDLDILNGTQLLATGHDATGTANTPANCATQLAFLPKKLKGWVIAFGVISYPPVDFSYCSAKITCTAGNQYELLLDDSIYDVQNTIANFDEEGANSIVNYGTYPFTCPQSGSYELTLGETWDTGSSVKLARLKLIKMPSQAVVDTEYMMGGYY